MSEPNASLSEREFEAFAAAIRVVTEPANGPQEDAVWYVAAAALDHLGIEHPPIESRLVDNW